MILDPTHPSPLTQPSEPWLPTQWSQPEVFQEQVRVGSLEIAAIGMSSRHLTSGQEVTASAAQTGTIAPWQRCLFELTERAAICEADSAAEHINFPIYDLKGTHFSSTHKNYLFPKSSDPLVWNHSKSNGVALHVDLPRAIEAAHLEAVERRRVLASWVGLTVPLFRGGGGALEEPLQSDYSLECYEFPSMSSESSSAVSVVGLFAFPKGAGPVVYGFAASRLWTTACSRAENEVLQRLAFLWGEDFAGEAPAFSPSPLYHQEVFSRASGIPRLRAWLAGLHQRQHSSLTPLDFPTQTENEFLFADITPSDCAEKFRVIKSYLAKEPGLAFGFHPPLGQHRLPRELWIHPIV